MADKTSRILAMVANVRIPELSSKIASPVRVARGDVLLVDFKFDGLPPRLWGLGVGFGGKGRQLRGEPDAVPLRLHFRIQ
jgi:hypothetical protein